MIRHMANGRHRGSGTREAMEGHESVDLVMERIVVYE